MKLKKLAKIRAFTLVEMMIAIAIAFTILGVTLTSSIALEKSFNSVDNYFATHMQQIRIVDYLARDVRRGFSVTSSLDKQTETVDVELANTEHTTTAITFKPISVADRNGTVVYSTAYLRNRRRSL